LQVRETAEIILEQCLNCVLHSYAVVFLLVH
jgi:hypothetical protein